MKRALFFYFGLVIALALMGSGPAWAGPVECGEGCGWTISIKNSANQEQGSAKGGFNIDNEGNVSIEGDTKVSGDGFTTDIRSFSGNVDPEIVFGLGATNTSNDTLTYAFAFSLPLGGLPTPIASASELAVTLTAPSGGSALLFPTLGGGLIVDSQDIRFDPFATVDKGVDVGTAFTAPAGTTKLRLEEAIGGKMGTPFCFEVYFPSDM